MAWAEGRCKGERVLVQAVQGWGGGRHNSWHKAAWGLKRLREAA